MSVLDVFEDVRATVFLRQTKINNIDLVTALANSHEEVVRVDITMDKGLVVDVLEAGDLRAGTLAFRLPIPRLRRITHQLIRQNKHSLHRELAVAEIEQILQTGSEKIDHHGIVVAFRSEPVHERDTGTAGQRLVDESFMFQPRTLDLDRFELDGNFLAGG